MKTLARKIICKCSMVVGKTIILCMIFLAGNVVGTAISSVAYPMNDLASEIHKVPTEIFYNDGRM